MTPIIEYIEIVDNVYGLFLDSTHGFFAHRERFIKGQQKMSEKTNQSIKELDTTSVIYGIGHPQAPNRVDLHTTTQGGLKKRNEKNGHNTKTIGNLCLCEIYHYWEDHYRQKIANQLEISKNELLSDIFGDIRNYRRSIIHNKGIAVKNVSNNKILKWFKENDLIEIDENNMKYIIHEIYKYLNQLKQ